MPSDVFVVRDRATRNRLLEYVVDKRSRSLEYLRVIHTTGEALWMNSVRFTLEDLDEYFESARGREGSPGGMPSPSGQILPHVSSVATASSAWVAQQCIQWLVLGLSIGSILQLPLGGVQLLEALYDLLLEFDVFFATNAASRALSTRALRKDREERGLKNDEQFKTLANHGGFMYLRLPSSFVNAGATHHFLSTVATSAAGSELQPSYRAVVPPLCSALQFTYRKLCDYDIAEEQAPFQKLLQVDRKLKHIFFGAISKELAKLAAVKLSQQRRWIMESVFAAFSYSDSAAFFEPLPPPVDEGWGAVQHVAVGERSAPANESEPSGGMLEYRDCFFDDDDD